MTSRERAINQCLVRALLTCDLSPLLDRYCLMHLLQGSSENVINVVCLFNLLLT